MPQGLRHRWQRSDLRTAWPDPVPDDYTLAYASVFAKTLATVIAAGRRPFSVLGAYRYAATISQGARMTTEAVGMPGREGLIGGRPLSHTNARTRG